MHTLQFSSWLVPSTRSGRPRAAVPCPNAHASHNIGRAHSSSESRTDSSNACSTSQQLSAVDAGTQAAVAAAGVGMRLALAVSTISVTGAFLCPMPAQARYVWQPRRHYRRLGESRDSRLQSLVKDAEHREESKWVKKTTPNAQGDEGVLSGVSSAASRLGRQVKSAVKGDGSYTVSLDRGRAVRSQLLPGPSTRGYLRRQASGGPPLAVALAFGAVLLAALVAALMGPLGSRLGLRWRWGYAPERGRWVRDRGLGGKLIFIPDDAPPSASAPLISWDVDTDRPRAPDTIPPELDPSAWRGGLSSGGGPSEAGTAPARGGPEWWQPPQDPLLPVSEATKEEARSEARRLIKGLEDGKLLAGKDYDPYRMVQLYALAKSAGISVRPRADNSRDSLFRGAADIAICAALDGGGSLQLGGASPAEFVTGIASLLGVSEPAAATMVNAAVAARAKSVLTGALAAQLNGNDEQVLMELLRLAKLLDALPLPPGSAEAAMVGAASEQRASLDFRKAVFFAFGFMARQRAGLAAEMLGFNPDLVLPQLDAALESAGAT